MGADVIDTATMQWVGRQMGSNPAGVYQDKSGRRFYVKSLESPAHARNEIIAAKLYQLAGAPTLTYVSAKGPNQIATELVELDKKHVSHLSDSERRQAQRWLGVHAWTANWDAAGLAATIRASSKGWSRRSTLEVRWSFGRRVTRRAKRSARASVSSTRCAVTGTTLTRSSFSET